MSVGFKPVLSLVTVMSGVRRLRGRPWSGECVECIPRMMGAAVHTLTVHINGRALA